MADDVYLLQRQHVAVKIEAVEGTDATPADADVIHPAYSIEYVAAVEMKPREVQQSSFSRPTQVAGEQMATVTFGTELKGSGVAGTVPPNLSALFQACSMGETIVGGVSVTYAPVSQAGKSVTVEVREGSTGTSVKQKKIVGARGTFEIVAVKGDKVMVNFTFTGRYIEPVDAAITQYVTPAITPEPGDFLGATILFHSVGTLLIQNVSLDIANTVVMRNDANQVSGNFAAAITGRVPVGSIDPEQVPTATLNFFKRWTDRTTGDLSYILNEGAGNITTVTAPVVQITDVPEGDRDGLRIETLALALLQSAQAGDDELSVAFT